VAIARQRHGKRASTATNQNTAIEELSEVTFFLWPMLRLYNKEQQQTDSHELQASIDSSWLDVRNFHFSSCYLAND
jgi:hypothetical protein